MNNRILCLRGSARMDTCDSFKQSATADSASSRRFLFFTSAEGLRLQVKNTSPTCRPLNF